MLCDGCLASHGVNRNQKKKWCLVIVVTLMGLGGAKMWGGGELLKSLVGEDNQATRWGPILLGWS